MRKELLTSITIVLLCFYCNTSEHFKVGDIQAALIGADAVERHECWPLEYEVTREDTLL